MQSEKPLRSYRDESKSIEALPRYCPKEKSTICEGSLMLFYMETVNGEISSLSDKP